VKKLIFVFGLIAFSCSENTESKNSKSDESVQYRDETNDARPESSSSVSKTKSLLSYKVIGSIGNYGYQIFDASGKMTINQPTIPAIQGNKGFQTEKDAQTAAEFVIQKINRGIFPPTFSVAELDSLGLKH
jgi:hypothetical protein